MRRVGDPHGATTLALRGAISRDIVTSIAELDDLLSDGSRAARLLLKAVRGLPEREQDTVLTLLVERALCGQATPLPRELQGALDQPDVPPGRSPPRPRPPPPPIPAGVLQGLGSAAAGMLLGASGVAEVGALCAITEEQVRDCLRDVSSGKGGPQPLNSYLELLADGRTCAQARRKLELTRRALEALREDPATAKLDLRLGRALLTKSQQGETLRALTAHVPIGFGPPAGTLTPAMAPAPHDMVRRLLLAGQDVEQIAKSCGIRVDAARAALHQIAAHPDAKEPLASILRLIGDGHSRAEVATELDVSHEELSAALDPLSSSPLQHKLTHAFSTAAVARPLVGAPAGSARKLVGSGALGPGAQQVVPVRFPEAQHQRLKDWCATHGFPMAVVVRGLVERFLDDQERCAA